MFTLALQLETDAEIIQEYAHGDSQRAATAFVRRHQAFVFSTALRFLKDYDDADDAAQEVFIRALRSLASFRGDSSIQTWLYKIAKNVCATMVRKSNLRRLFRAEQPEHHEPSYSGPDPLQSLENADFEQRFRTMLSRLPEKQRETFALRYFEELSYEEISSMLGTSVGGLKANYFQAVRKLSQFLSDGGSDSEGKLP